jgi:predicted metal-dependent HD superfamily phosphohydrolase
VKSLVALLTFRQDRRADFQAFERSAQSIMVEHGVQLEKTLPVDAGRELHIVRFEHDADFSAYRSDPRLAALAPVRAAFIMDTRVFHSLGPERWKRDEPLYFELLVRHCEPHRRYHTLQHLDECFRALDQLQPHSEEVALAVWFHDAIYDTRRHDNEERSAQWAKSAVGARVHDLVLATRHDSAPDDAEARLLVDVDLAILAAPADRFDEYEAQIREEYAWVPEPTYRRERRRILEGFLARERIFSHPGFDEAQARNNLSRALARL